MPPAHTSEMSNFGFRILEPPEYGSAVDDLPLESLTPGATRDDFSLAESIVKSTDSLAELSSGVAP
jgi:hypothetical protein